MESQSVGFDILKLRASAFVRVVEVKQLLAGLAAAHINVWVWWLGYTWVE
jgi:hypothetical protein